MSGRSNLAETIQGLSLHANNKFRMSDTHFICFIMELSSVTMHTAKNSDAAISLKATEDMGQT